MGRRLLGVPGFSFSLTYAGSGSLLSQLSGMKVGSAFSHLTLVRSVILSPIGCDLQSILKWELLLPEACCTGTEAFYRITDVGKGSLQ